MVTILGSTAKCPKCGCHDFAIPREAYLDADITCLECGYICTVKQALDAEFAEPRPASRVHRRYDGGALEIEEGGESEAR